jgi:hypothetical protein
LLSCFCRSRQLLAFAALATSPLQVTGVLHDLRLQLLGKPDLRHGPTSVNRADLGTPVLYFDMSRLYVVVDSVHDRTLKQGNIMVNIIIQLANFCVNLDIYDICSLSERQFRHPF